MSDLEAQIDNQIWYGHVTPLPEREYRFAPPRRWRFDFAWPELLIALEVEGGTRTGGRHVRGDGYEKDCEKYNEAAIRGWRILRVTASQVRSGEALGWIQAILVGAKRSG